ncbi:MAG: nucleoside diphosphate kinase regulator [Ignavibacteriaceae bacterium]
MKKRKIYVTEKDKTKLMGLFASTMGFRQRDLKTVRDLLNELERAEVISDENPDYSVVTMNSTVLVEDLNTKEEYTYTIVYPENADSSQNKISILAPVGTALLGYKTGDVVEWEVPAGKRKLRVKDILCHPETVQNNFAAGQSA